MERMILGLDGSPASSSALAWVAARASRRLSHVDLVDVPSSSMREQDATTGDFEHAETYLRQTVGTVEIELHRWDGGLMTPSFAESADLLVFGTHTGPALAGDLLSRLSIRARVPVAMIPVGWFDAGDPVTVGVAEDGSSDAALAFGAKEARRNSTALRLVHAWLMPTLAFGLGPTVVAVRERHQDVLDSARRWIAKEHPDLPLQVELVRDSAPAAILRFAQASSLLTIGTHRRSVVSRALFGSVARGLQSTAECPVVIVPTEVGGARVGTPPPAYVAPVPAF